MLMQMGEYQFELNTALYQELVQRVEYRWSSNNRVGKRPAKQFMGVGEDNLTLTGVVFTNFRGGYGQIDEMRRIASRGTPLLLVAGDGYIFGWYVITSIEEIQSHIAQQGQPLKQAFTLELSFYGDRVNGNDLYNA